MSGAAGGCARPQLQAPVRLEWVQPGQMGGQQLLPHSECFDVWLRRIAVSRYASEHDLQVSRLAVEQL